MVSVIVMFVSFLFSQLIFYLQQTSKLDAIKFDIETITASDFTVEYEISKEMYEEFECTVYPTYEKQQEVRDGQPTGNNYSKGLALKKYLVDEIQKLLADSLNETKKDVARFEKMHGKSKATKM